MLVRYAKGWGTISAGYLDRVALGEAICRAALTCLYSAVSQGDSNLCILYISRTHARRASQGQPAVY